MAPHVKQVGAQCSSHLPAPLHARRCQAQAEAREVSGWPIIQHNSPCILDVVHNIGWHVVMQVRHDVGHGGLSHFGGLGGGGGLGHLRHLRLLRSTSRVDRLDVRHDA